MARLVQIVRYEVKPGHGDEVAAALDRFVREHVRQAPGTLVFQICRARENPDHFVLVEHFADRAALDAHRATPGYRELIEGVVVPLLTRRDRDLYDLVASRAADELTD